MKVQNYDTSRENINVQDMFEDIKNILNLGRYEFTKITSSEPSWTEGVDGIAVLSVFGATRRLYISDMSAAKKWVYVTLTEL